MSYDETERPIDWYEKLTAAEHRIADLDAEVDRLCARFTAPIVCLCGSTRFKQAYIHENARLTGEGNIVLSVGLWGHHERVFPSDEVKAKLDALHLRKIDLCHMVYVLDVGGYIGESTRREIAYAERIGRPVHYLSHEFPNYVESVDPLEAENARLREALLNESECLSYARGCIDNLDMTYDLSGHKDPSYQRWCVYWAQQAARRTLEEAQG